MLYLICSRSNIKNQFNFFHASSRLPKSVGVVIKYVMNTMLIDWVRCITHKWCSIAWIQVNYKKNRSNINFNWPLTILRSLINVQWYVMSFWLNYPLYFPLIGSAYLFGLFLSSAYLISVENYRKKMMKNRLVTKFFTDKIFFTNRLLHSFFV